MRRPAGVQVDEWEELDCGSCIIYPPGGRPKALVHFLGGAFVGRAPHVSYQVMCRELCDAGFAVATTPYDLTFEHVECALRVAAARDAIIAEAFGNAEPPPLIFGVGHSNGALLHALMASLPAAGPPAAANVLISYNNKSVKDAIPFGLPQGSDQLVSAAQQLLAAAPPPPPPPPGPLRELATGPLAVTLSPVINQLGSAFDEIARGRTEFSPSPQETRQILAEAYASPATLLVRFSDDSIDETEEIARVLRGGGAAPSGAGRREVEILRQYGGHVTACGADLSWGVRRAFSPADAIAQAAKAAALLPTRLAAREVARWLDRRVRTEEQRARHGESSASGGSAGSQTPQARGAAASQPRSGAQSGEAGAGAARSQIM